MTLLAQQRRLLQPCLAAATVAAIALASGCALAPSAGTFIPIRSSEGARWITVDRAADFGCEGGALACSADGGRLSERRCRCSAGQ
jgi:hypothetical protein